MELLDSLNSNQKEILNSFQSITSNNNLENSLEILNNSNWNLELAITKVYDGESTSPHLNQEEGETRGAGTGRTETEPLIHSFDIDDSQVTTSGSTSRNGSSNSGGRGVTGRNVTQVGISYWLIKVLNLPITIISYPVTILYSATSLLLTFIACFLNLRTGFNLTLRPRNPFGGPRLRDNGRLDPYATSEKWISALEELTGGVRWSRRHEVSLGGGGEGITSGIASGSTSNSGTGGSGLNQRGGQGRRKVLPNFFVGSYEDAVKKAKEEIKILVVVLTCEEHENDLEFKTTTLVDSELVKTLSAPEIIVWGGDIRDRDCYQASRTLQYLSLPFVAFICLQPLPLNPLSSSSSSSSSSSKMTIITRLEGSPTTSTSSTSLLTQLNTLVLPRVTPFLNRLRNELNSRENERRIRAEQDRNYAIAAGRDEERVLKRRKEEFEKSREKVRRDQEERELEGFKWTSRRWREAMRWKLKREEVVREEEREGGVRLVIRLGDGRRAVRVFKKGDALEEVYRFVECVLEKEEEEEFNKRVELAGGVINFFKNSSQPPFDPTYTQIYQFRLATTFPRLLLEIDGSQSQRFISEIGDGILLKGGNLVVEGLEKRKVSFGESLEDSEEEEEN